MTPAGALIFLGLWAVLIVAFDLDRPSPRSAYARLRPRISPRPAHPPAGHPARAGDPDRDSAPAVNGSPVAAHGRRGR
jgi:hypothetical protein